MRAAGAGEERRRVDPHRRRAVVRQDTRQGERVTSGHVHSRRSQDWRAKGRRGALRQVRGALLEACTRRWAGVRAPRGHRERPRDRRPRRRVRARRAREGRPPLAHVRDARRTFTQARAGARRRRRLRRPRQRPDRRRRALAQHTQRRYPGRLRVAAPGRAQGRRRGVRGGGVSLGGSRGERERGFEGDGGAGGVRHRDAAAERGSAHVPGGRGERRGDGGGRGAGAAGGDRGAAGGGEAVVVRQESRGFGGLMNRSGGFDATRPFELSSGSRHIISMM
mmetsp:Transcript_1827/g.7090  ORF Transcript_1827/g.7090 Transcript_1827/m.7090 type:complete len:279 (-) Transcript_1827:8-844(-)